MAIVIQIQKRNCIANNISISISFYWCHKRLCTLFYLNVICVISFLSRLFFLYLLELNICVCACALYKWKKIKNTKPYLRHILRSSQFRAEPAPSIPLLVLLSLRCILHTWMNVWMLGLSVHHITIVNEIHRVFIDEVTI